MSYYIAQKVSRVSQNARVKRSTPCARCTARKECPQLPAEKERPHVPAEKERPQVPGAGAQLDQTKVLRGVVDAVVVNSGRYVGRGGLDGLLRVAHGNACAHGRKH